MIAFLVRAWLEQLRNLLAGRFELHSDAQTTLKALVELEK